MASWDASSGPPRRCEVIAYLLALGSAVFYGAADFVGGVTTRRAGAIAVVTLSQASGLVLVAVLLPVLPRSAPSTADLVWGGAAGLAGGVGVALLYHALAVGTMAVVAPTTAVCAVTIPVVVAVLLGERPEALAVAGIVLGIGSIVLVSQTRSTASSRLRTSGWMNMLPPGMATALGSGVAIGLFYLTLAQTRTEAGMWPLLVARAVSVSFFGLFAATGGRSLRMPARVAVLVVLGGIVDMLANALYMLAARQGPLSVVVTLSSLYPASTVLLARVVLGERLNGWQLTGVGCALAAVVLIVGGGQ